jgi:hypothetical protein
MVLSVRVLYPNGVIQFQQYHSSIQDSRVVQEWLSLQTDVELIDWPPGAPDMDIIENMWSEVNKTIQETWPDLLPTTKDALWTIELDACHEVTWSLYYVLIPCQGK